MAFFRRESDASSKQIRATGFKLCYRGGFLKGSKVMGDIISTASGLQYEILESGSGATPGPTDTVSAHYHGTFEDGRVFDSSVERGEPIDLPVNGVIAGWTEALQMMKEGDKWRLTVPPKLGYGADGVGPIPGNSTLVFEVELITVR
jgi:FKBP-type peptidyl-prolyl cis-trans isomerase FklB|tara:strand:+ start:119 stop:559 length:441 start_codon:yes stop_codon:yes gene_type:complete